VTDESLSDASAAIWPDASPLRLSDLSALRTGTGTEGSAPESATAFILKQCQTLGVQLVVLTPNAPVVASVPAFIFDELASSGHPIALGMRQNQVQAVASLWDRCGMAHGDEARGSLPASCDREWFSANFCAGKSLAAVSDEDPSRIWPHVSSLALHDPLALAAACHRTCERFFDASVKDVGGVEHLVIGTAAHAGVRNPQQLRSFLLDALSHSLAKTLPHALAKETADMPTGMPAVPDRKKSIAARWRAEPNKRGISRSRDRSPNNDQSRSKSPSGWRPSGRSPISQRPPRPPASSDGQTGTTEGCRSSGSSPTGRRSLGARGVTSPAFQRLLSA